MWSDDIAKSTFPLWWSQHPPTSQRRWISVWIGFNLPPGVFSISPREHKCTSFVLDINVARCLTACSCKRSDREPEQGGSTAEIRRQQNTKRILRPQPSAGIWRFLCVFHCYLNGAVRKCNKWKVQTPPSEECSPIVCISDRQLRAVVSQKSGRPDDE